MFTNFYGTLFTTRRIGTIISCVGSFPYRLFQFSLENLHVGHVGGAAQKNVLLVLLWAPANVGEKTRDWLQVKDCM